MSTSGAFCGNSPLWNITLLLDASWPQFTACFQSSVLVLVPNGFLWCALLPYLPYLLARPPGQPLASSWHNAAKTALSVILSLCAIIAVLTGTGLDGKVILYPTAHYMARLVEGLTYLLAAVLSQIERSRGVVTSGVLFVYWLLLVVINIIPMYSYILLDLATQDLARVVIFFVSYVLIVVQLILQAACADLPRGYVPGACPETTATFLSCLTCWWISRLITSGFRKPLEAGDLWRLNPRDESATVVPKLERALEAAGAYNDRPGNPRGHATSSARSRCNDHPREDVGLDSRCNSADTGASIDEKEPLLGPGGSQTSYKSTSTERTRKECGSQVRDVGRFSLLRVMVRTYCADVLLSYACKLCSDLLQYVGPVLLSLLIKQLQSGDDQSWTGYVITTLMLGASWLQTAFYHQHYHVAMTTGMRMKTALMAAIYRKSLRLSADAQRAGAVGEAVSMMAVDCQRVQDAMSYTWMVWSIPLQLLIAVYLLWDTLGVSVLAGVGLLVLLIPVNGCLAVRQQSLQKENLRWKDKRLKLMDEIIGGMKVLKLYAWESAFRDKVLSLRKKEVDVLLRVARYNAASVLTWTCAPYLVTLTTFATYVLTDSNARLDAGKAFVTLSLFNILQFPIAFGPEMISFTAQASVSIKRIDQFLKLGELDRNAVTKTSLADSAIRIKRGSFAWDASDRSTLHSINLDVSEGELVAVVGSVGSGKSSLISAILGELERRQGEVVVKGSTAYVPQQAWIQNSSLRDNILFGQRFDRKRYSKVIDACALKPDLEILPGGDQTEIGEKGLNLSGGQRQRVSLARAVYANSDVYLLDDPLSAVDSHVGKHIFRKVLGDKGVLKHKTRVLVTHAVHWLPLADKVVLMREGRVAESGTYLQLIRRDGALCRFLRSALTNTNTEDVDIVNDPEVLELRQRLTEHVDSVTSTSEGGTSGDDAALRCHSDRILQSVTTRRDQSPATSSHTDPPAARLTEDELAATGRVQLKVFGSYASHLGRAACVAILVLFGLYQVSSVYADVWLTHWTQDPTLLAANSSASAVVARNRYFLAYYGVLGAGQAVFVSVYAWLAAVRMTRAAGSMHDAILDSVFLSPVSFFDTTPSGRIVNRFARDVETVDNTLPQILFMFVMCVFSVVSTLAVISFTTPLFFAVILPLGIGYYAIQRFFVPTSRQLKRLEAVTRSPIFSHFSETLSGASVIRAYRATERFTRESLERIDKNQVFYFAGITANRYTFTNKRWLGVWIEVVSSCVVFAATMFAILTPDISAAQAGLSITYALQITQTLKWLVRTVSDLETNVVSVERLHEYSQLKPEASLVTISRPSMTWPSHGDIIFTNYSTRYRRGLDLVVKDINIHIHGGEKVGIVGRTGAGKSSLILALFRLLEPTSGTITIDGLDITSLGLQDLRSRLTVLPQDPVLFSGSLRLNLDPFGQFSDRELWDSLHLAHLLVFIRDQPEGLDYDCGPAGKNLSVGQRQLVCLARGLLRKTRILVLDEPTASVDPETDSLIQGTIRRDFSDSTTITIAHRLNTVMDYDRVLVMEEGRAVEFDKPSTFLQKRDSLFYTLAWDAGLVL